MKLKKLLHHDIFRTLFIKQQQIITISNQHCTASYMSTLLSDQSDSCVFFFLSCCKSGLIVYLHTYIIQPATGRGFIGLGIVIFSHFKKSLLFNHRFTSEIFKMCILRLWQDRQDASPRPGGQVAQRLSAAAGPLLQHYVFRCCQQPYRQPR